MRRARFGDQRIDLGIGIVACERMALRLGDDARAVAAQDLAAVGRARAQRIEAFVVPAQQRVLRGAADCDRVQRDVVLLPDAIEAADALFEQIGIERQVPQDQVMRELEVAAFRADLGAQQHARALGFGEPRGVAVALQDRHAFVEARDLDARLRAQRFFEREHLRLRAADQQELLAGEPLDQRDEPRQARIVRVVVLAGGRMRLRVGMELGEQALAHRVVELVAFEHVDRGDAAWKSADLRAAIAEHDAAGAVAVDQRIDQRGGRGGTFARVAVEQRQQIGIVGEDARELVARAGLERRAVDQRRRERRELHVAVALGDEGVEIGIARGIEQAKPREMAGAAELLRRRGQQHRPGARAASPSTSA